MKSAPLWFGALVLFAGNLPLDGATLTYQLSGVVQSTDRETPPSLNGAPAVMILSYDTDSYALRSAFADTDHMSVLAFGILGVNGVTVNSFTGSLLYERPFDLGPHLSMDSGAGFGNGADGNVTLFLPRFPQFQPDRGLFPGTQFTGDVGSSGVLFSSPGLPANTNNEGMSIAWNTISLIPEPSAAVLCAAPAGFIFLRRRRAAGKMEDGD